MSRIKTLPKEQKEDWKKELDNNRYVQEGIQILAKQAAAEAVEKAVEKAVEQAVEQAVEKAKAEAKAEAAEEAINAYRKGKEEGVAGKEEAAINAYQRGKLSQLKANIASMKSKGMTEEEIKSIFDLEELPDLD